MAYLGSDLVKGALRLLGVIASGEAPSVDEAADGFTALQQLMSNWSANELTAFATQTIYITCGIGVGSYLNSTFTPATRPVKILGAEVVVSSITLPMDVVGPQAWAAIEDKQGSSFRPKTIYCDYGYTSGGNGATVYVAPQPAGAARINLFCLIDMATLANDAAAFDLPEGYAKAIRYALAVDLAAEYGRPVTPELMAIAKETKQNLINLNASNRAGKSELALPPVPAEVSQ